jgi:hypothetical protein
MGGLLVHRSYICEYTEPLGGRGTVEQKDGTGGGAQYKTKDGTGTILLVHREERTRL